MYTAKTAQTAYEFVYLINKGSLRPAFANSTSTFGNVAENRRVCLLSGSLLTIPCSCSPKPISNNLKQIQVCSEEI